MMRCRMRDVHERHQQRQRPRRGIQARHRRRAAGDRRTARCPGRVPARPVRPLRQARPPAAADPCAARRRNGEVARPVRRDRAAPAPPRRCASTPSACRRAREAKDAYDALEQARVEVVGARFMDGVTPICAPSCRGVRVRRLRPHDPQGPVADRRGAGPAGAGANVRRAGAARRRSACWTSGATRWATAPTQALAEMPRAPGRPDRLRPRRPQAAGGAGPGRSRGRCRTGRAIRGRRRRRRAVRRSRTTPRTARASRESDRTMLGAQPEEMEGEAADEEGPDPRTKPRLPRATTVPAARSRAASGPTRTTRPSIAPTPAPFDEEIDAEELCDPDELSRLRQQLDQQLQHLQGVISEAGQPAAAPPAGAADPVLGVRPRGGHAGCRPARPRGDQPDAGAVLQARAAKPSFATPSSAC